MEVERVQLLPEPAFSNTHPVGGNVVDSKSSESSVCACVFPEKRSNMVAISVVNKTLNVFVVRVAKVETVFINSVLANTKCINKSMLNALFNALNLN